MLDMKRFYKLNQYFLTACMLICSAATAFAQINFAQSELNFGSFPNVSSGVTSLMYGPDGRLYVAEYPGTIKVYTVQRNGSTNYQVTAVQTIAGVKSIVNHDDDGTPCSGTSGDCSSRETTGLTVGGTASNPVIYVSSSDFRIGAGSGGGNGDVDLDTNSGVITRITWTGSSWDVVDLVRGLPRSEENHATNGLELVTINGTKYLIVASGGITNGGGPSTNFVYTCEYALSAAILSINLDQLNGMSVKTDGNGRKYLYNIPTLDDPTRPNANGITDPDSAGYNGIDVNDPWGGNDGLNQAMVVPGGPVQIYSPGYRNAYDLVVTASGALYVTDNGANQGWGGFPVNEGTANVTNAYDPAEPGSQSASGGEQVNNQDHLQLVTTNMQSYSPGSYYGGHPNPTRANPNGAGLFTAPAQNGTSGAVFRTLKYDPNGSRGAGYTTNPNIALPANWPPVPAANSVEGDWRGPGISNPDGPNDNPVTTWGTNTNGIDEYTASNFGGAMQGNLLAGDDNGVIRRVRLNANGSLNQLTATFLSGIGGNPLGITCNGDAEVFPGTIWAGTLNGKIVVFEPQDFVACINPGQPGYNPNADYDSDGYTNQDEVDNGTDPCNGGSQPSDFDKVAGAPLSSDLNDTDDDADGIPDASDPFQLGNPAAAGSDAFNLPVQNDLFNDQQGLGGIFGLGLTGLMNNGNTGANWLNWLDRRDDPNDPNPNDVLGGAPGLMTSHMTSGTCYGTANNQEKGYQYGIKINQNSGIVTVVGNLISLTGPLRLYGNSAAVGGELGHFIGDGTQSNYIKIVLTVNGITALQEINDVPQTPINVPIAVGDRPSSDIEFYFVINPGNGQVTLEYAIDGGARNPIGTINAQGSILSAIQNANTDLAIGFTGTSGTSGVELEGTWDFLNAYIGGPTIQAAIPNLTRALGAPGETLNLNPYFDDDNGDGNLTYTVQANSNPAIGAVVAGSNLNLSYPSTQQVSNITIRATDSDNLFVDQTFTVTVTNASPVLYRVNAGGPALAAIDGGIAWGADQTGNNSPYLSVAGTNNTYPSTTMPVDASVNQATTPLQIYASERYDNAAGAPNMTYSFPVATSGNYEIRLYMGNSFAGTSQPGQRIFDVTLEGAVLPKLNDMDLSATFGHEVGTVISHILKINDGAIDISFLHGAAENPLVNAIEIIDAPEGNTPIYVHPVANQNSVVGQQLNGNLGIVAIGGDGNLQYQASGLPPGLTIEPTNGQIGGTVAAGAQSGSPYSVLITIDDGDSDPTDRVTVTFNWTITGGGPLTWIDKNENENYTARHECSFVQAGNKFYLMGGRENARTLDVYDYTTNSWTSLANSAPVEFNHYQATQYQGLIWVIGAFKDNAYPNETPADYIWMFDPAAAEWIRGPEIPQARKRGSAGLVVHNDKFYVVGGNTDGHDGGYVSWFDEYNPATGTWTALPNAPRARDHFHAAVIGNNLYAVGGRLSGGTGGVFKPVIPQVDVYNFTTGTWSTLPAGQNLPTPRGAAAVANFNGKLIVAGGEVQTEPVYGVTTSDAVKVTEQYDPATGTWTRLADLNFERHGTQAIVSGPGVFVTAGSPNMGGGNQKNMEVLGSDSPQGTPSQASSLSGPASVQIPAGSTSNVNLLVQNGNVGKFVRFLEITGSNAANFSVTGGNLTNAFIPTNSSRTIQISHQGLVSGQVAQLVVHYGVNQSLSIPLSSSGGSPTQGVTSFTLVNATSDADLLTLTNGMQINQTLTQGITLSIRANTNPAVVGSVQMNLTGPITRNQVEGLAPYSLYGDSGGGTDYSGVAFPSGTYTITATAYSGSGLSGNVLGTLSLSFSIGSGGGGNQPPTAVASATPLSGNAPLLVNFTGSASTDDVGVTGYSWNFGDGGSSTQANPSHTYSAAGQYTASLTVTDGGGLQDTETVSINVTNPSQNGVTSLTLVNATSDADLLTLTNGMQINQTLTQGITLSIRANTNPAVVGSVQMNLTGPITRNQVEGLAPYSLYGDSGGGTDYSGVAFPSGTYTITATAYSGSGLSGNVLGTLSLSFSIGSGGGGNQPPTAVASATPLSGNAPLLVNFTGSASTDDVGVTGYSWNFGDGGSSTQANPSHTYSAAGQYTASLTVTDGGGLQDTETVSINVSAPPSQGVVSFTLINADTDMDLTTLTNGQQISASLVSGVNLNIRANTNPATVGSVSLNLSGATTASRTENTAPYALFGDDSGDYLGQPLPTGSYTISGTAYSGRGLSGTNLGGLVVSFSISNASAKGTALDSEGSGEIADEAEVIEKTRKVSIVPNPADAYVDIILSGEPIPFNEILVFDSIGRLIRSYSAEASATSQGVYRIPTFGLEEGVYVVRITTFSSMAYSYQLLVKHQ